MFFDGLGVPGAPKSYPKSLKYGFLALLDALGALWSRSRPTSATTLLVLRLSWAALGLFGVRLGASWVALGTVLGCLGGVLGSFGVLSDCLQVVQGVHTHNLQKPKEKYGFSTILVSPGRRNPTPNR